jgi:CHAT domain-containing protein
LTEADVVHVSARASPQGVFLEDGVMDGPLVQGGGSKAGATSAPLVDRLRCRLLILSACFSGDLGKPESFVFPLVRKGINVLAATEPLLGQAAYAFFRAFYQELLPARRAEGVELAQALRRAAADGLSTDIRRILWTKGINSFILYGDPSLQLRLRRFDPTAR